MFSLHPHPIITLVILISSSLIIFTSSSGPCPGPCYCDPANGLVTCVGDSVWQFSLFDLIKSLNNNTRRLEISNYPLARLLPSHLSGFSDLVEVKLSQMNMSAVGVETFIQIKRLIRLDLSENLITKLARDTFNGLGDSLKYLDLSSNLLEQIDFAFLPLKSLEQLNLRGNRLVKLVVNSFAGLKKLQYLNLDRNRITTIESGTFIHLPNLAHLLISNNLLPNLTRLDSVTTRLQYIDISGIGLEQIPQGIDPFVRDLRLARNQIKRINLGDLDNYLHLSLLVLDDNQIEEIEEDALGRLDFLIRLWLNGNHLKTVPLRLPSSLRELYLEENQINSLDNVSLKGLLHLERLFLRRNQITSLHPNSLDDLSQLKLLDIQLNKLTTLPDNLFLNLNNLRSLDISQNPLQVLPSKTFVGLSNLDALQLSRIQSENFTLNEDIFQPLIKLTSLDLYNSPTLAHLLMNSSEILGCLSSLQDLNLVQNEFNNLRSDLPNFFPHLRLIKLNGNRWACDEHLKWLLEWMQSATNLHFHLAADMQCHSPVSLQHHPITILRAIFNDTESISTTTTTHDDGGDSSTATINLIEQTYMKSHSILEGVPSNQGNETEEEEQSLGSLEIVNESQTQQSNQTGHLVGRRSNGMIINHFDDDQVEHVNESTLFSFHDGFMVSFQANTCQEHFSNVHS